MKNFFIGTLLVLCCSILHAQEFKTPLEYLNYISKEQGPIAKSTWKYTKAIAHSKSDRKIDATKNQLIKSIQKAKEKINLLKEGYKGDVEYKDQVLQYFEFCELNLNEEYNKIINMKEVAEQSYDAMEAYLTAQKLVNEKMDAENDKVDKALEIFAKKNNIKLSNELSELGAKIKLSNEVFDYRTGLYLIFFKCNYTEQELLKAMEQKDLKVVQQNMNALQQYADEGLLKLKTIKPYQKDESLINATKRALEYFKKEVKLFIPMFVNQTLLTEKFENAEKTLNAKVKEDQTKEEIDNFNKMVNQINSEVAKYNAANDKNNFDRSTAFEDWNTTADNFISNHVPVD